MNLTKPPKPSGTRSGSGTPPYGPPPPSSTTEHVEELLLASRPSAMSCARMLVGSVSVLLELSSTAALALSDVVDELVAHSVATVRARNPDGLSLLAIRVRITEATLLVEVWDTGAEPSSELIDAPVLACARWGFNLDQSGSRVIWCAVRRCARQDEPTKQMLLPQRSAHQRIPPPARPVDFEHDLHLLQRVVDGLRALEPAKPAWPQQEQDA